MIAMSNAIDEFRQTIEATLGYAPDDILDDGAIHRSSPSGRGSDKPFWYVMHSDGVPAGAFGDWKTGLQSTWCAKSSESMTQAEREANKQRVKAMQAQRDADTLATQQQASETALQRWNAATLCTEHSYLTAKGVQGHGLKVEADGFLIVPMRDTAGKLWNIERINPADGKDKRGLYNGRRTGCYHAIGKPAGRIIICEGYATGASIHEATGDAVAVSFNAGGLMPVALALHDKHPGLQIIMAADDDHLTDGNPGMSKAMAAALAVGGLVAAPSFPAGRPDKATDFNDLHQLAGLEAVKACMDAAIESVAAQAGMASDTGQIDLWPELQPLIAKIDPQAYPLDALPDAVRCAVEEVAGFVKAPVPLIATSALAALSLAIQTYTDVQRAEKLDGPCGLFLLAIADSGERKSTCDGFLPAPYATMRQRNAKPQSP